MGQVDTGSPTAHIQDQSSDPSHRQSRLTVVTLKEARHG
jgi:hypothetical protein